MASHDLRDVLNLPSDHAAGFRPTKKQKLSAPRSSLKGLAREVQSLGGDNPIAIVPEVSVFKKRRLASRKPPAKWEMRQFKNSARGDDGGLVLRHWRRKADGEAPPTEHGQQDVDMSTPEDGADGRVKKEEVTEDSSFAKFNVQVVVPQYNEDQYSTNLANDDWTKEETDYLLELAKVFDLRWPIIWDRYEYVPNAPSQDGQEESSTAVIPAPKPRTMEDLKARYYEVAAKMMAVQKPAQYMTRPEFELYEMMTNFNPAQEKARKDFAINSMARSKDEAREEESLLLEIRRILARTERFNEERRELYNRLDYPHTDQDISAYKSSAGLQTLLQNLMSIDKSKKRRSLMGGPDGVSPASAGPNGQAGTAAEASNRRESIAALGSAQRDSQRGTPATPADAVSGTAGAGANKKKGAAAQVERRKLSEQEEQVYGLTYHERLGSGPTFRYEKINKLYSHKSGQQQLRITNALGELDVPPRLVMPTAAVTSQFEVLWAAVTALVDLRKVGDKLDAEIKLEEAKKAERDKANGVVGGSAGAAGTGGEGASGEKGEASGGEDRTAANSERASSPAGADTAVKAVAAAEKQGEKAADTTTAAAPQVADDAASKPTADGQDGSSGRAAVQVKEEDGEAVQEKDKDKDKNKEKNLRPGSSGAHKRSASVLSTTSDKSTKRQKK
ncbi:hypothetical protein QBC33DRAFT_563825 [Phialemonium atrogriseum]|uniref:SWR1-complex protein 4 n=1 Tax=Phialemonium atrogriseum TaxID=1093897 RepID=A0AAJ0FBE4_9PEZI|nr:uncharacterized protein QBC33DRAFT_563825 [Phialemonium atrogriseum]KAK1762371.1 hypothetical protein QBC33DRAFT_563825 [Phialemonium atrogriseum]